MPGETAHTEAEREALAMALHASRPDEESARSLALILNGSANPQLVVYHLALLPSKLLTGFAAGLGEEFDFEKYVQKMLHHKPGRLDGDTQEKE
jgi:hypothetical protein